MAKGRKAPLPPLAEARELVLTTVQSSAEPLTAIQVAKSASAHHKITRTAVKAVLDEFVVAGLLHEIRPATPKGQQRYWNRDELEFGRLAILKSVETKGPQSEVTLKKAVK